MRESLFDHQEDSVRARTVSAFATEPAHAIEPIAPELSVVIPIFNEEGNIPLLCERLAEVLDQFDRPYEIIAVDDGSRDTSFALLRALAERDSRLRVVRLRR